MDIGSVIGGRYTILKRLGEGATKEVFLATDGTLSIDVALGIFKPHIVASGFIDRVRREARTNAALNHPNIVRLHDFREDDGWYLVAEYVAGSDLKAKISKRRESTTDLDSRLGIAAEVADALGYTHSRGVFHRDVKPSNVMLTLEDTAKLGDFGLAKPLGDESLGSTGLLIGTIPYMSPEATKGLHPDSFGDMYSFGVLLYELAAGRRPFQGSDVSVLIQHQEVIPPRPTRYVPDFPKPLENLVLRLLAKDPMDRPEAAETSEELRAIKKWLESDTESFPLSQPPPNMTPYAIDWAEEAGRRTEEDSQYWSNTDLPDQLDSGGGLPSQSIRLALISDTVQHPLAIVPGFFTVLALIFFVVLEIGFLPFVAGGFGVAAVSAFLWMFFMRYDSEIEARKRIALDEQDRAKKTMEKRALEQHRDHLHDGFCTMKSGEGLRALNNLVREYGQLSSFLDRPGVVDRFTTAHLPGLAAETYSQALSILGSVLELLAGVSPSNKRALEAEITRTERQIVALKSDESESERLQMKEVALNALCQRVNLIKQQELQTEKLIHRSNLTVGELERTRIEIAAMKAGSSEAGITSLVESLRVNLDRAKEVQAELRKLGY